MSAHPGTNGGWHTSGDPRPHTTVQFDQTYHLYPSGGSHPAGMEAANAQQALGRLAIFSSMGGPWQG